MFGKDGSVRRNIEHPPRAKEDLEIEIVSRFLETLSEASARESVHITIGDEPVDVRCVRASGDQLGVQLAEVVNHDELQFELFKRAVNNALSKRSLAYGFRGTTLTLIVSINELTYLTSKNYREVLQRELLDLVDSVGNDIHTLAQGKKRTKGTDACQPHATIVISVTRKDWSSACRIHWGGGVVINGPALLVRDIVCKKISKNYPSLSHEFWLLVYSTSFVAFTEEEDLREARAALGRHEHPFDRAYLFMPLPNRPGGHIELLWPPFA
ncbi:MAG: hypothetical protein ACKVVT_03785 [Dehalococcoidia bacterium]